MNKINESSNVTLPNLKTWAEAIVYIAREGNPAPDRILKAVEDELRVIARKYQDIGDKNGWWQAIEDDTQYILSCDEADGWEGIYDSLVEPNND